MCGGKLRPETLVWGKKTDTVRSVNLPDDVFEVGEKKPQKKGTKGTLDSKKRGPSEVLINGTAEGQHPNKRWKRLTDYDRTTPLRRRKDSRHRWQPPAEGGRAWSA